ncbi:hypothetical protein Daus18300_008541 [Diaporthe australafricana]|uniref:Aminoglycoside phosphotransferase domain-containing protein n=1 Tax=Diaporthe australafricana TaxID=127596 RepID=A0ABR3WI72_9PEZI
MPPGEQGPSKRQLALSWHDEDIISVFRQTPALKPNGNSVTGFGFPREQPVAHVKFGLPHILQPELRNHEYVFRALRDMPQDQTKGIRIPEVYRTLESDERLFIVMEYVPGKTLQQVVDQEGWESQKAALTNSIARAMRLLMSIPVPAGQKPGPVGGGHIRHPLFKDHTSFRDYPSVDELEQHLNIVATLRDKTAPTVSLEKSLCFYYSDFYASNFIFTDAGDLCLIDFDQAGFLPPSFMSFALAESFWFPGLWVSDVLRLAEHNLPAMKRIHYFFMIGSSSLVAVKGLPRPDKKRR